MYVLCDTCSVLMLIRIAPDMFIDEQYDCVTVPEVRKEFFQTQKFKTKYPWRDQYKKNIKALAMSQIQNETFELQFSTIKNLIDAGIINKQTERLFDLSYIDQKIAAYSIANEFILNSTDKNLCDFVEQQFDGRTITPLGIINDWLEKGIIQWNNTLQTVIEDWERSNERPQPQKEARRFKKLTGKKYTGPIER